MSMNKSQPEPQAAVFLRVPEMNSGCCRARARCVCLAPWQSQFDRRKNDMFGASELCDLVQLFNLPGKMVCHEDQPCRPPAVLIGSKLEPGWAVLA